MLIQTLFYGRDELTTVLRRSNRTKKKKCETREHEDCKQTYNSEVTYDIFTTWFILFNY